MYVPEGHIVRICSNHKTHDVIYQLHNIKMTDIKLHVRPGESDHNGLV